MKIEKISDTKIKCTLTREDLEKRSISLGELVYGSDSARALFREMITEADRLFGFQFEGGMPIMVEAIPQAGDTLTLIITKVDDPAELDTRFARFSPTNIKVGKDSDWNVEGADDVLDLFRHLLEAGKAASRINAAKSDSDGDGSEKPAPSLLRVGRFNDIDDVIAACRALRPVFDGISSLYRLAHSGAYVLVIHQSGHTPEEFNKICNTMSEYGETSGYTDAAEAYLREHETTVVAGNAVQKLGAL